VDFDAYDALTGAFLPLIDTKADASGQYVLCGFPAGQFHVVCDPDASLGLYSVYQGNHFLESDATPLTIAASPQTLDFALAAGARIAGSVLDGVTPVPNVDIDLYLLRSNRFVFVPDSAASGTNPVGAYATGVLPPSNYVIRVDPLPQTFYSVNYYTTNATLAPLSELASTVTVGLADATGINLQMFRGGNIAGVVTHSDAPVPGMDIDVFDMQDRRMEVDASSDALGNYTIGSLPGGLYKIRADPTATQGLVPVYFSNALFRAEANPVAVTNVATTSDISFVLDHGGFLAGQFTRTNGAPAAGIDVDVFDATGREMEVHTRSLENGGFLIGPLPSGSYTYRADPDATQYLARTYYSGTVFSESAQVVSVSAPLTNAGLNLTLGPAGAISGFVYDETTNAPLAEIDLDAFYVPSGVRVDGDAKSGHNGAFVFGPLPPGAYTLRADPEPLQFRQREYWAETAAPSQATAIAVNGEAITSNVVFSLSPAGAIAGYVFDASTNVPLADIDLDVYDAASGSRVPGSATTGTNGAYLLGPLPPGGYRVRAEPIATQFCVREYFSNAAMRGLASTVTVTAVQIASNISFSLDPGASIFGLVTDLQSNALAGVDLDVFATNGNVHLEQTALTDLTGQYAVGPVPLGAWAIRAHPSAESGYETRYYVSAGSITAALPVVIVASQHVNNVNFLLGTNFQPVAGIAAFGGVSVSNTLSLDGGASVDANGDRLLYRWRQVSGPPVTFSDTNAADPTIVLPPGVTNGTAFSFELVARDFTLESAPYVLNFVYGPPVITACSFTGGLIRIQWTLGSPPQPYALQSALDLRDWTWTNVVVGNVFSHSVAATNAKTFYRVAGGLR
jgi:hypothetical protein